MSKVNDPIVTELLRDIGERTSQQFIYEDPWHGFVPYGGAPTEYQIGPPLPFAELGRRDKADVIDSFIPWGNYQAKGLDWRDQRAIENNVLDGKPPEKWLDGTSFLDPALRAERREELIEETFELSRQVGYAHFRAENFDRPAPALLRLSPPEREAFLRQWWDAAREEMYSSYREQVAGLSNEELASNREAYKEALGIGEPDVFGKTPTPAAGENHVRQVESTATLKDQLFGATPPAPTPETAPQPEHSPKQQHKL